MYMFLCYTCDQVSPRRSIPLSSRLKGLSRSKMPHVMKVRPCVRPHAAAVTIGARRRAPLSGAARNVCPVSSLQRTSARLKMVERRTTARFLHISPRTAAVPSRQLYSEPKHSLPASPPSKLYGSANDLGPTVSHHSETAAQRRFLPHSARQKEFYSKYICTAVSDRPKVRQSARLADTHRSGLLDKEDTDDVSRTFIRRRFSHRRSEDDGQNFPSAGRPEKMPWHSAVLQQSDDGGLGRFVIRRSRPQPTSVAPEFGRRPCRSVDIYGSRYSRSLAMQAAQSAAVPSDVASLDYRTVKTECVSATAEKPGGDERLLYTVLSRSMVGFDWLASVS